MTDPCLKPVLILLTEGFADWETGLLAAATTDGLVLRHASPDGSDVSSIGGMRVTGLETFAPTGDEVVVICGGTIWERPEAPDIGPALMSARQNGAPIAAICGGVRPIARIGLLDGVRHTSNGREWLAAAVPGYAGAELHEDSPSAVADKGIVTASGTMPTTFALKVLEAAGFSKEQMGEYRAMLAAELA